MMMLHSLHCSHTAAHSCSFQSLPEENDESMNKVDPEDSLRDTDSVSQPGSIGHHPHPQTQSNSVDPLLAETESFPSRLVDCSNFSSSTSSGIQSGYSPYQPPLGLPPGYSPQTPFPSQADGCFSTLEHHKEDWHHTNSYGSSVGGFSNGSQPFCLVSGHYASEACYSHPLPDRHSPGVGSLDPPGSLHSIPTALAQHSYYPPPCPCPSHGPPCCSSVWGHQRLHHLLQCHQPYSSSCPKNSKQSDHDLIPRRTSFHPPPTSVPSTAPLSLEQRKVFVTYEADNERHVKEVINFVALLRHNGFYTHIDMFEQQFRSISKIDFMERYITEKDYLIIIAISPKYYEIVTNASLCLENDETLNTVYIHKQLQNEFIQNGCKNFRFVPVLFPGAKRCHVPTWLQNTHVFSWPRDRDDILRRLMRVEKYNPPPIGELPTIVSIPI